MLLKKYKNKLKEKGWQEDKYQIAATSSLQRLYRNLNAYNKFSFWLFGKKSSDIKGIYLYGGVGRGKSMLMDMFFESVSSTIVRRRIHFHEFMIETHDWLHKKRGERVDDLMPRYAEHVANHVKLLCFDEFHVTDVADAMILGRLFTELFNKGVIVVATSNWAPDNLYEGGLQRELFLPFIDVLKQHMEVIHLDSENDYRKISDPDQDIYYFYPLNSHTKSQAENFFIDMIDGEDVSSETILIKKRKIKVHECANGVAKFSFSELCEKPHGAEDFIAISRRFHTVFITGIPILNNDMRNEVKRLILLIDCLYEEGCRVVITADEAIDNLYQGKNHALEFDRTVSRLIEMQSNAYHETAAIKRLSVY